MRRNRRHYHQRLVAAFVEGGYMADVAQRAGVSRRTAERWKAVPEFWADVVEARGQVIEETVAKLRGLMPKVAEQLGAIAKDASQEAYVRVRALAEIRTTYLALQERTELDARLAELERLILARRDSETLLTSDALEGPQ